MFSNKSSKKIIGITGPFGSGKSTAASFFNSRGYKLYTLSKPLEDEAKKRKLSVTRKNLQDIGNEWRKQFGNGILVKKALEKKLGDEKIVIDGIRNLGEIEELRKNNGSIILAIIADREIRLKRLKKLKRRENLTEDVFVKLDSRDMGIGEDSSGLQVAYCIAVADSFIDSNSDIKEFEKELEDFLKKYER